MKMMNNSKEQRRGSETTQLVCAAVFLLFTFVWLFWFQADLMAVAQHTLSHGTTRYSRTVGTVVITLSLLLLARLSLTVTRLYGCVHALNYLPSMLLLALLGCVNTDAGGKLCFDYWWGVFPVLTAWGVLVWMARRSCNRGSTSASFTGLFSRRVWTNVLLMVAMMLGVAAVGNTNAVAHYRAHAETALSHGDYDEALRVGRRSLETDESLTMLRAYALSRQNKLGDRFFHYPLKGSGADLLPAADSRSHLLMLAADSIWRHLGARPAPGMTTRDYLKAMSRDTLAAKSIADYVLCAALVDRDLDSFVSALSHFGYLDDQAADSLPHHYREALILYTHLRSHPQTVYHHNVMDEDWNNLQDLEQQQSDPRSRKAAVFERYRTSYWYYYYYGGDKR